MRRPLLLPACLFTAGVMAEEFFGGRWEWLLVVTTLILFLAAVWARRRVAALAIGIFLTGWLSYAVHQSVLSSCDVRRIAGTKPELVTLRGEIAETPALRLVERQGQWAGHTTVRVTVSALKRSDTDWQPVVGDVTVSAKGALPAKFFRTQQVEIKGVLQAPPGPAAEGLFDYRTFLRWQGIWFTLATEGASDWRLADGPVSIPPLSERFLPWASAMLGRGLPDDETTRLLAAMALGWKTPLTGEVDEVFMESGTMHVFAISGLHIALIAGMLVQLLRLMRMSRAWCGWVAVPLIWFYVAATGWQASAIRSAIMSTVVVGGWALRRPGDILNSLAAAALAILVWDPGQLFQASFQLSFGAVTGLALLVPHLEPVFLLWLRYNPDPFLPDELRPRWQRWLEIPLRLLALSLATCAAAFISSLPLTWHYFHLLNPVSLVANLVVVPLSSLALAANFASLITGPWWPWLGEMFNASAWVWMHWMVGLSRWFAALPGGYWYVTSPAWGWWVPYYLMLLSLVTGWAMRPGRRLWCVTGAALWVGAALTVYLIRQNETRITFLGGAEATFIDAPWWRKDVLLDAGDERGAAGVVVPFLRAHGVNRLPLFVTTTADVQHLGGVPLVLEKLRPHRAVAGPAKARSKSSGEFLEQIERHEIPLRHVAVGEEVGGWRVAHPAADDKFTTAADNTLVLQRELGGMRVLLLGGLGRNGQRKMLGGSELPADVVVVGIPNEGEPLGEPLREAIGPQVIVLCSGEYPASRRLKQATRERLEASGRPIVYTHDSGAVTLRFYDQGGELSAIDGRRLRFGPTSRP